MDHDDSNAAGDSATVGSSNMDEASADELEFLRVLADELGRELAAYREAWWRVRETSAWSRGDVLMDKALDQELVAHGLPAVAGPAVPPDRRRQRR